MEEAIAHFLAHLQEDKGFSPNTVVAYRNDLDQLLSFLHTAQPGDSGPKTTQWNAVKSGAIQRYILTLQDSGYAQTTIARKIASVKSFFNFLQSEKLISSNPSEGFTSPGIRRPLPKTISAIEVDELLLQPLKRDKPEAKRDCAMLSLLYATGMRVTELVKLNIDDVILDETFSYVRCQGRNTDPRLIPLPEPSIEPIKEYLANGRHHLLRKRDTPALFLNRRGEQLTRQGFWLILKSYVKSANLSGEITPHMLRHTFATHMLQSGQLNLRELQECLGHASITTTQVYTQIPEKGRASKDRAPTPAGSHQHSP